MERTQSERGPDVRPKIREEFERFEDKDRGRARKCHRSPGRRGKGSVNFVDWTDLERSNKVQTSSDMFSCHRDLFCEDPKAMAEVQVSYSESLPGTSQQKRPLKNLKSEKLRDLKSELQTVSEADTVRHVEGAEFEAHTKAKQLEFDPEVQRLREELSEKEKDTKKMAAALKKAEDLLRTERLRWQQDTKTLLDDHTEERWKLAFALKSTKQVLEDERYYWQMEKSSLLEEKENSAALHEVQLDEQKCENKTLAAALRNVELEFETRQAEWQEEKSSFAQKMQQEVKEAVERAQASHQAKLEEHRLESKKMAAALKKAEDLLQTERLSWQQDTKILLNDHTEKTQQIASDLKRTKQLLENERNHWQTVKVSLLEERDNSAALHEVQLDEQKCKNKTLTAALMNVEEELQRRQVEWQEEKTAIIQKMQREAKEAAERSQASHQAKLEEHRLESKKMAAALKKAEDLLRTERLCWQQDTKTLLDDHTEETRQIASDLKRTKQLLEDERCYWEKMKVSLLEEKENSAALYEVQLDEQKGENKTLSAALMKMEKEFECRQAEWQEEKSSLIQKMQQEANEAEERSQALHQVQLEEHREATKKMAAALKETEDLLKSERLCWEINTKTLQDDHIEDTQQIMFDLRRTKQLLENERNFWQTEKSSLLEAMEKSKALHEVQLNEQKCKTKTLAAALMNCEQELVNGQVEWREEKRTIIQRMQREAAEAEQRSKAQLEEHREETKKMAAAVKKAEDLLQTERLNWQQNTMTLLDEHTEEMRQIGSDLKRAKLRLEAERNFWQKEKVSLLAIVKSAAVCEVQLDEQSHQSKTFAAALKRVEQKLESNQMEWQEEKISLIQAREDLKRTLQEKEQEWEETESAMKSQLEDLMKKKTKKRKWYRWLFGLP